MRNFLSLSLLALTTLLTFGCATDHYNIPQETVEQKIKVVGVAPFMTDEQSDVRHPEKEEVLKLVKVYNAKNEKELTARLRETGVYYAVQQLDGDPAALFTKLVASRERRDDAGIIYNKFFYKRDQVKELAKANGLDALMLVTVSGLTQKGKVYSSNYLSYLETDYNYLSLTAQLLDRDGNVVWEYPNFRQRSLSYPMLLALQYPDFDEAAANMTEKVDVKFKTIAGVTAAFNKTKPSAFPNGAGVSEPYLAQFDEMISLLKPAKPFFGLGGSKKEKEAPPAAK